MWGVPQGQAHGIDADSAPSRLLLVWVMSPTAATPQRRALVPLKVVTTRSGWVEVHSEDHSPAAPWGSSTTGPTGPEWLRGFEQLLFMASLHGSA